MPRLNTESNGFFLLEDGSGVVLLEAEVEPAVPVDAGGAADPIGDGETPLERASDAVRHGWSRLAVTTSFWGV